MTITPICLAAIVKNEESTLPRMLASFEKYVTHFAFVDTGSDDGTLKLLQKEESNRANFRVIERPWKNFGYNRTESLELAREVLGSTGDLQRGYILVADADETMEGPTLILDYRPELVVDLFYVSHIVQGTRNVLPTILRADHPFYYAKAIHECVTCSCPQQKHVGANLTSNVVVCRTDSVRGRLSNDERHKQVIRLLEEDLTKSPDDPHANFYTAQSYLGLQEYDKASEFYRKRAAINDGCPEHKWYSNFMLAAILEEVYKNHTEAELMYLRAWALRPQRIDPLLMLARSRRWAGRFEDAYMLAKAASHIPTPGMEACFIIPGMHDWMIREEVALCAASIGNEAESISILLALISERRAPKEDLDRFQSVLQEILDKMKSGDKAYVEFRLREDLKMLETRLTKQPTDAELQEKIKAIKELLTSIVGQDIT